MISDSDYAIPTDVTQKKLLEFGDFMMPHLIYSLLQSKVAEPDRILDVDYLQDLWISGAVTDAVYRVVPINILDKEFIDSAKEALDKDRKLAAIILIATAIEHRINVFYRLFLGARLPDHMITDIIRSSFHAKSNWLMILASEVEIPENLNKRLKLLIDTRNSIIHYKAIPDWPKPASIQDSFEKQLQEVVSKNLLGLPDELQVFLDSVVDKNDPYRKMALDAWEAFKKEIRKRRQAEEET